MERRLLGLPAVRPQLREADGEAVTIEGYGAVFYRADDPGTQYQLWRDTYERIVPGAFDRAILEDDVRSLFNHDSNFVLGRSKAGTLTISVDQVGLRYAATPDPTSQTIRDLVVTPIRRGDVDGASFMFVPRRVVWIEENRDGVTVEIRQIEEVKLYELGPVVFPAYESTTAGIRAATSGELDAIRAERDDWRRAKRDGRDPAGAVAAELAVRLRMIEIDRAAA